MGTLQKDNQQKDSPMAGSSGLTARSMAYLKSFPRPVWLLMVATFVESTGRFMVVPYLSLYMRDAGVSLGTLGLVLGAAPVANVIFGAWGGQLSDRWGRKPVQVLGVALSGLAMFGFAFTGARPMVLAFLNFMNGMTRTFYRPATSAALADLCPPHKRSEAFALNRIAINAAFGLGPVLGVVIFQAAPKAGFIIGGLLNLAVGLYIALVIPESAPFRAATPQPATTDSATNPATRGSKGTATGLGNTPNAWAEIARDAGFWVWTAGMTLIWGAYDLIQSFLPLHLRDNGIPLWTYGTMLTINAFICVVAQLPASRALRVAPIAPSAAWSKLAFAVGFLGFAFLGSPVALMMSMVILSFGEVWGSAVQPRYIPEHARPSLMGRYMGLSTVSELGRAAAAPVAGFLMSAAGGEAVFIMAACLAGAGGVLLYLAGKAQDQRPRLA
jgi:MFS family permease